jgi:hypothetical protein
MRKNSNEDIKKQIYACSKALNDSCSEIKLLNTIVEQNKYDLDHKMINYIRLNRMIKLIMQDIESLERTLRRDLDICENVLETLNDLRGMISTPDEKIMLINQLSIIDKEEYYKQTMKNDTDILIYTMMESHVLP